MRLVELRVRCDETAPAEARRALIASDSPGWVMGDVALIASELVTNAVLYSGCTDEDEIELQLDRTSQHLRLSVIDPGRSGDSAALAVSEERAFGGMGLFVVDQLSVRWGAERSDRYRVWAEVALARPESPAGET